MSLAGFEGSVELRFTSDKSRGNAKIHDAIHSLAKIQGTDADRRNCGHWFVGVDPFHSHTTIEGRYGDGL